MIPKGYDVIEHVYSASITEEKKGISVGKATGLRMVLHQLLQLQFLPLLVVLAGEPPLEAQPTHAHTVKYHLHQAVSLQLNEGKPN